MPQTSVYDNNVSDKEKMVELGKKAMFDQVAGQAINQAAPRYLEQGYAKGMQDNNLTSQMAYEQGLADQEARLARLNEMAHLRAGVSDQEMNMVDNMAKYGQANTPEIPKSAFLENNRGY